MYFPASPEIHLKILTTLYHRLQQKSPATPLTSQDAPLSSENGQRPQSRLPVGSFRDAGVEG